MIFNALFFKTLKGFECNNFCVDPYLRLSGLSQLQARAPKFGRAGKKEKPFPPPCLAFKNAIFWPGRRHFGFFWRGGECQFYFYGHGDFSDFRRLLKPLACGRQSWCLGWIYKLPGGQKFSINLSPLSVEFPQRRPLNLIKRPRLINSSRVRFEKHPACSL